jgi:glycerophosphoryl diester phosphodiesterase
MNVALMSHRGGALEAVENTMPAFRRSVEMKVDLLELDVQMTKDGIPVIFHDRTLDRMCGIAGRISDYLFEELPPLKIPLELKHLQDSESRQIPRLDQVTLTCE